MAQKQTRKLLPMLLIGAGVILLGMYVLLLVNGGKPSIGMLIVGIVDLLVGMILSGRAKAVKPHKP